MYGWHVMGECEDRQIKYFHTQKNYKNFKGGYGGL
jgi:hypothetical protein